MESSLFQEIVRDLEQHEESIRIKKLIFCASKKYWENDLEALKKFTLKELVADLIALHSNINLLSASLQKIAKTLNRQELYLRIANIISCKVSHLYSDSEESTQLLLGEVDRKPDLVIGENLIKRVVNNLKKHEEALRIKKLIFSACKKYWESDAKNIDRYPMKDLVVELHLSNQTIELLKRTLVGLVENLNRKELYTPVADIIVNEFSSLYSPEKPEETEFYQTAIVDSGNDSTNIALSKGKPNVNEALNENTHLLEVGANKWQEQAERLHDKFELRMKLMQYANPLRVKILLFSAIYPQSNANSSYWTKLKSHTLDDLLSALFSTYHRIGELESQLYFIANSTSEPDVNMQTANAIVESVKPLYDQT